MIVNGLRCVCNAYDCEKHLDPKAARSVKTPVFWFLMVKCMYKCVYVYIYIYIEREREGEKQYTYVNVSLSLPLSLDVYIYIYIYNITYSCSQISLSGKLYKCIGANPNFVCCSKLLFWD